MSDAPSLLIDPSRLSAFLPRAERFHVLALAECASTNTALMQSSSEGAVSGTVLVADRQSAGRGSRGRVWASSPEASLTFSLLWIFPGGAARLSGLSLAVGVAVARALERCGAADIGLKWPNDILYGEGKLGGILVELKTSDEMTRAVAGIGLNLRLPENIGETSAAALPPAALEQILAELPDRHVLLAALLDELAQVFERFATGGFAVLREEWLARHVWQNRPVYVLRDGRVENEGVCAGADADGALLVRAENGLVRCVSGDVSLRPR